MTNRILTPNAFFVVGFLDFHSEAQRCVVVASAAPLSVGMNWRSYAEGLGFLFGDVELSAELLHDDVRVGRGADWAEAFDDLARTGFGWRGRRPGELEAGDGG